MGDRAPLVTAVVTTFNRPALLRSTVRAILRQTVNDLEVVVVDNFSNADVRGVLAELQDERVRFMQNANEGVIGMNRNWGIRQARGRFVAFCDDDDLWFPEKLERQLKFFDPGRHIGVGSWSANFGDTWIQARMLRLMPRDYGLEDLLKWGAPPLSSLMVLRGDVLFSEESRFRNVEDFEFQIRLVKLTGKAIGVIGEPLVHYRVHAGNSNLDPGHRLNALRVLWRHRSGLVPSLFRTGLSRQLFLAGLMALRAGDKGARGYLRRCLVLGSPTPWKARLGYVLSHLPTVFWPVALRIFYAVRNARERIRYNADIDLPTT